MTMHGVLLVENEKVFCEVMSDFLADEEKLCLYYIDNITAADEMLEKSPERFDILVLSIDGTHGIEYLHELRQKGNRLPVIIITRFGTVESCRQAFLSGANDYLLKPLRPKELIDTIKLHLQLD